MCCVERAVSRGFSLKATSGCVLKPSMSWVVFVWCVAKFVHRRHHYVMMQDGRRFSTAWSPCMGLCTVPQTPPLCIQVMQWGLADGGQSDAVAQQVPLLPVML